MVDNSSSEVFLLEVRIWETEEHLLQLPFPEVIGEELHSIGSDNGAIEVRWIAFGATSQCTHALTHIVGDLLADLHA